MVTEEVFVNCYTLIIFLKSKKVIFKLYHKNFRSRSRKKYFRLHNTDYKIYGKTSLPGKAKFI